MNDTIQARIASASEYLSHLSSLSKLEWHQLYKMYTENRLLLVEKMCLIHPVHYDGVALQERIQGSRSFVSEVGIITMECQAAKLWGYSCKLADINNYLVADHIFPYSLGGPTIASNKLYLCKLHNQVKTNDIHFYPWENGEPIWLKSQIDRINNIMMET